MDTFCENLLFMNTYILEHEELIAVIEVDSRIMTVAQKIILEPCINFLLSFMYRSIP